MDRDELMDELYRLLDERRVAQQELETASAALLSVEKDIGDIIDQLQPRIELTKPRETTEWKDITPSLLSSPSARVLSVLAKSRLGPANIAEITGLSRKQIGPCLGSLVKRGLVRNAGNGTWTAA